MQSWSENDLHTVIASMLLNLGGGLSGFGKLSDRGRGVGKIKILGGGVTGSRGVIFSREVAAFP